MHDTLKLIGRKAPLFAEDVAAREAELSELVAGHSFLVIGGAGSIGQATVRQLFQRKPKRLYVVDISENNLVELVRDLRSSLGYIPGDFRTFVLDAGSEAFAAMMKAHGPFDYLLNLSALKHVRSEKDPFTLMRMIEVNILFANQLLESLQRPATRKYFAVSTDKAANPVNLMGASKRIMELFLLRGSLNVDVSTARFANVAFSDGSLLHGFNQRLLKRQPLSAPRDVRRYFLTPDESGELCLLSCLLGQNRDIFFPKLQAELNLISFAEIAVRYLQQAGFEPHVCVSEEEARQRVGELSARKMWPCYFFDSDTTGEKEYEEFYIEGERIDWNRFRRMGVIQNEARFEETKLRHFLETINGIKRSGRWTKGQLLELFEGVVGEFSHKETNKYLDERM